MIFQGSEKEMSPLMPNVAKLLHLQVFGDVLKDFKRNCTAWKFFLKQAESFITFIGYLLYINILAGTRDCKEAAFAFEQ